MLRVRGYLKKGKKVASDFIWSIAATMVCTIVVQMMVYPLLAKWFDASSYGELLTIMGLANIFVASMGNGINNTRLIQNEKYSLEHQGDFNILLGMVTIIATVLMGGILFLFFSNGFWEKVTVIIYVILGILRSYWSVAYRLKINYYANFKLNLMVAIGYIAGLLFVKTTGIWAITFVIAEFLGILYLMKTTDIYREKNCKTELFNETTRILAILCANTIIANAIIYLDRLILYPLIGGTQVSIFTVSSFVGKSIGLVLTPIAGVLLSYYAQDSFRMTLKKYWLINLSLIAAGSLCGGAAVLLGPWITGIIYPTLIEMSMPYIYIANIGALIGILSNVISPAVLKYADAKWQLIVQIIYAIIYFGLGVLMLKHNGLYGFCIAALIANILRVMILLILGNMGIKKRTVSVQ